jgi:hypothetical protein
MVAITQRFSATLAAIADAVKRGELSSEQGKEMSADLYQLAQMQLELPPFFTLLSGMSLRTVAVPGAP